MEDSLKKRYIIKLIANIINGLVNMLIVALVPKALGPIAYGQFIYLQQFFSQVIGFLDAGTSTAFFTKLSKNVKRVELIKFYVYYALVVLLILVGSVFLLDYFNLLNFFFNEINKKYIYLAIVFSFMTWFTTIFIYISDANALTVSVESFKIIHKILSLFLLLIFINYLSFDLENYYYYNLISLSVFITMIIYLFFNKNIFFSKIFSIKILIKKLFKEFYVFSSPLFVFNIISITTGLFDIWLLQTMAGSEQVGYYGLSYSIAAMCFLFTSAMTPIITREFAKLYENNNINEIKKLFSKYIPMLYSIATYFGVFIAFQSANVIEIFTDEKFKEAYLVLTIMAFYPIHQTYGQLSGSMLYVTGNTKLVRNIGVFTSLIGLGITILLLYVINLEAVGLGIKMVIIQIISVNIQLYFNSKYLKLNFMKYIYHQVVAILFFVSIAYLSNILVYTQHSLLTELLLSGFIYTILVTIGVYFLPNIFGLTRTDISRFAKFSITRNK